MNKEVFVHMLLSNAHLYSEIGPDRATTEDVVRRPPRRIWIAGRQYLLPRPW